MSATRSNISSSVYKDLEEKTETRRFGNRAEAEQVIEDARRRADAGRI